MSKPIQLYLIDDEASVLEELTQLFTANSGKKGHPKYEISTAKDGMEAYRRLIKNKEHFDIIITNIKMPIMDGRELLEHLQLYRPTIPVIIYSILLPKDDSSSIYQQLGAFAAISKAAKRRHQLLLDQTQRAWEHKKVSMN